jgi:hypothetical protein
VGALRVQRAVLLLVRIEVPARRRELRALALADLVDVHALLAGGKSLTSITMRTPPATSVSVATPTD